MKIKSVRMFYNLNKNIHTNSINKYKLYLQSDGLMVTDPVQGEGLELDLAT